MSKKTVVLPLISKLMVKLSSQTLGNNSQYRPHNLGLIRTIYIKLKCDTATNI